jgi:hypothetical protein
MPEDAQNERSAVSTFYASPPCSLTNPEQCLVEMNAGRVPAKVILAQNGRKFDGRFAMVTVSGWQ